MIRFSLIFLAILIRGQSLLALSESHKFVDFTVNQDGSVYVTIGSSNEPKEEEEIFPILTDWLGPETKVTYRELSEETWIIHAHRHRHAIFAQDKLSFSIDTLPIFSLFDPSDETPVSLSIFVPKAGTETILFNDESLHPTFRSRTSDYLFIERELEPGTASTVSILLEFTPTHKLIMVCSGLLFLIIFIGGTVLYRAKMIISDLDDIPKSWVTLNRIRRWIQIVPVLVWLEAVLLTGLWDYANWNVETSSLLVKMITHFAVLFPLPVLVMLIALPLINDVDRKKFGGKQTSLTALSQLASTFVRGVLPIFLIAASAWAFIAGELPLGAALGGLCLLSFFLGMKLLIKSTGLTYYSLTEGDLRDRIFEIAKTAGVDVKSVIVGASSQLDVTMAAVVRNGVLFFTDDLVTKLSKREVDAVMSHEMAHLQRKDVSRLKWSFIAGVLIPFAILEVASDYNVFNPLGILGICFCFFLGFLLKAIVSRSIERRADSQAFNLSKDPEALIRGLVKLTRLNRIPLEGSWPGFLASHPSTVERTQKIAERAGLSKERLAVLTGPTFTEDEPEEHFEIPMVSVVSEAAFSLNFQRRSVLFYNWVYRSTDVLIPLLIVFLVTGRDGSGRFATAGYVIGLILTLLAIPIATRLWLHWIHSSLFRQIHERRNREKKPIEPDSIFVGFSPDAEPRRYDGFLIWDFGFLDLFGDSLIFQGEKTCFQLARNRFHSVALVNGPPMWRRSTNIVIRWKDEDDITQTSTLYPCNTESAFQTKRRFQDLHEALTSWARSGESLPATPDHLTQTPPPTELKVTSVPAGFLAHPAFVIRDLIQSTVPAILLCFLLGISCTPGLLLPGSFVVASAALATFADYIPYWVRPSPSKENPT